jgi:hypothetical protein
MFRRANFLYGLQKVLRGKEDGFLIQAPQAVHGIPNLFSYDRDLVKCKAWFVGLFYEKLRCYTIELFLSFWKQFLS